MNHHEDQQYVSHETEYNNQGAGTMNQEHHEHGQNPETIPMTGFVQQQPQQQEEQAVAPKRRLGRGLDALLGGASPAAQVPQRQEPMRQTEGAQINSEQMDVRAVPVANIFRNPNQPRKVFSKDSLRELADSLLEHGMLQPIIVRQVVGGFQIVAGERRWLASQQAGLTNIPCRVIDVIDKTAYEYAFEENLKRQDLSDIEKAMSFREYLDMFNTTVDELARQLSMSRSSVSNTLRLLDLPVPVKNALQDGKISAGHARAMLTLGVQDQLMLAEEAIDRQWTVRQMEQAVRDLLGKNEEGADQTGGKKKAANEKTAHLQSLQDQLRDMIGAQVEIKLKSKDAGKIIISFGTNDEFEGIMERLRERFSSAA